MLIVLWTLALLSLLISQLTGSGGQALRLAGNLRTQAVLQAIADGVVQEAGFHLAAGGAAHWPADGAVRTLRENGAEIRLRITNEAGRINPSIASLELMTAMLQGCGLEQRRAIAVASAITAWRFPTAQSSFGPDAYRQAGLPYSPPGQPFESIDELGLVLGMTPGLLACLAPHLSLYRDSDPDPNAADPAVLSALAAVLGGPPGLSNAPVEESVLGVEVTAIGADGARATRRATLRMDPQTTQQSDESGSAQKTADALAPFRILAWGR